MTLSEVMKQLESLGTEQNRKTYARHRGGSNCFGVSFAELGKLQKQIKTDHALAGELWETGNVDARSLATMIAAPAAMSPAELDRWVKDAGPFHAGLLARYVAAKSPHARKKADQWTKSKDEFVGEAGWNLTGILAAEHGSPFSDEELEERLATIEQGIHKAKNRTRYGMNGALIAIGARNERLRKRALEAAGRIGKVEVDHGDTGCKTPDAAEYIRKIGEHRGRKAVKKAKA